MVSSILNSSNLVLATAMVVSSTAVFLAFLRLNKADISPASDGPSSRQPEIQILRPCLSSGGKKERKKKKVQFAESVKEEEETMIMAEHKKRRQRKLKKIRCRSAFPGIQIPENGAAPSNGILRDRSHRMGLSC